MSLKDRIKKTPIADNNTEDISDKEKESIKDSGEELNPKSNEELNAENPNRKKRRQATPEELANPLHGVKLAEILERLVEHYGWEYLADRVNIRCFQNNPSMKSSLGFLRKTKWARNHVEDVYLDMLEEQQS